MLCSHPVSIARQGESEYAVIVVSNTAESCGQNITVNCTESPGGIVTGSDGAVTLCHIGSESESNRTGITPVLYTVTVSFLHCFTSTVSKSVNFVTAICG